MRAKNYSHSSTKKMHRRFD